MKESDELIFLSAVLDVCECVGRGSEGVLEEFVGGDLRQEENKGGEINKKVLVWSNGRRCG